MTATAVSVAVSTAVSIATPDPVTIFSVLTTDPPHSETSTAAVWNSPCIKFHGIFGGLHIYGTSGTGQPMS